LVTTAEASAGLEAKLDGILARHEELGRMMAGASGEAYVELAKEYAEVEEIAARIQALRAARAETAGLEGMLAESGLDAEMRALAEEELAALEERIPALEQAVRVALLPNP
jgi:peptide chain release factor 1